jgi:hypothetical protein
VSSLAEFVDDALRCAAHGLYGGELALDPTGGVEAVGELPGDDAQQPYLGSGVQVSRALGEVFDHARADGHPLTPDPTVTTP